MTQSRIDKFNQEHPPFYMVAHEDGEYSLCYSMAFTNHENREKWQAAFNDYAEFTGEPAMVSGLYTHGSGYEWEEVFKKAFENDPNLAEVKFDCENDGFFCYSRNQDLLENMGDRFYNICNDMDCFGDLVLDTLKEMEQGGMAEEAGPNMTM